MAGAPTILGTTAKRNSARGTTEGPVVRWTLTIIAVLFMLVFVVLPAINVFSQALSNGVKAYAAVLHAPKVPPIPTNLSFAERRKLRLATHDANSSAEQVAKTWSAIRMTMGIAAVVVPLNLFFGVMAAWAIAKFRFKGRSLLISLIDLPFSVSPVVAGLIFVLMFGRVGWLGNWATHFQWPDPMSVYWRGFGGHWFPLGFHAYMTGIIFTPLAIVLASIFVTFPFVARSLIPLMESQGNDEELAALSLGASGWRTFRKVTLPNIKWGLLYGVILCTARAFGEFGAVSVVSGHIDSNDTIPLRVEKLWAEPGSRQAAFTVASLLASLAVLTLIAKSFVEWKTARTAVEEPVP